MVSNDTGSSFTTTISSFILIIVNVPNFKCSYQSKFLQLNFLKHFLGGGFIKHMQVCFLLLMVLCHLLDFLVVYCQINCSSEWSWEIFLKWWKQENEFLQDVFGFTPKKKHLLDDEYRISSIDKVGSYQFLLAACTSLLCVIFGGISIILNGYLFHIVYVPFCLYIYSFFFLSLLNRGCISHQTQLWARLGPNYLTNRECYLRWVFSLWKTLDG